MHPGPGVWAGGVEQQVGQQFALLSVARILLVLLVVGRRAAAGARLDEPRREGAERRTGAWR